MSKNKIAKKVLASSAALCLVLSSTSFAASAATIAPEKLGGDNRFDTAIKIAEASWKDAWKGSKNAILASGNQANLVDALAVAPLAYELKAPILLDDANKDVVNEDTLKALKDNGVTKVYIATGTGVISEKAEAQLKEAGMEVVRLGGASRYDTAENILDEFKKNGGKVDTVALVAGTGLADALSVAPVAAKQGMPILLTNGKDKVAANLEDVAKAAKKIYAVGGDGIIADALVKDLKAERLGGANRFDTNAAVVKAFAKDGKVKFDKVYFAEGINGLVDALTGSVLAAQSDAPVVLTNNKLDKMADTKAMLKENITDKTELNAFGKTVVEDSFLEDVKDVKNEGEDGEVKVDSVSALNLHQIKVTLTGVADKDEATKTTNYEVKDEDGHTVKIAEAELDGKNVTLTLEDKYNSDNKFDEPAIKNQTKIDVTVDKAVFEGDKDYEVKDLKITDTTLPEVEDVKVVGSDTIKVKFSEPIKPEKLEKDSNGNVTGYFANKSAFEVKSGDGDKYYVKEVQLLKGNNEANVVLYSDLKGSKVSIKVNGDVKDYADFGLVTNAIETSFEKDEEKPYVTEYKDVKADEVTLVFNEDVRLAKTLDEDDFYHTNSNNKIKTGGVTIDGNEVTLKFDSDHKLPDGTSYIMINDGALEDLWGNEIDSIRQEVERVEDKTKPEVDKIEQDDDEKHVKVSFSEKVQNDSKENGAENEDNYTLLDEDGKELKDKIRNVELNDDEDEATVEFKDDLDAGDYSLVIDDIADQSENKNKLEKVTKDFTITDKSNPNSADKKFAATLYDAGEDDQKIVVDFKEKMATEGKYAVNDINNYQLIKGTKTIDLDDYEDASIDVTNEGKSIEIRVPNDKGDNNVDLTGYTLRISRVADASDNKTDALYTDLLLNGPTDIVADADDVKATKTDVVEIEFPGRIDLDTDDIKLQKVDGAKKSLDDAAKSVKTNINDDGNTVVTITLNDDTELKNDAAYADGKKLNVVVEPETAGGAIKSKNEYGAKLANQSYEVKDEIAPALEEYDVDTENSDGQNVKDEAKVEVTGEKTITLKFAEPVDARTISASTFEVNGYDVLTAEVSGNDAGKSFTTGDVVTLTLDNSDSDYETPDEGTSIVQKSAVRDAEGNVVDDIDTEVAISRVAMQDAANAEAQKVVDAELAKVKASYSVDAANDTDDKKAAAVKTLVEADVDASKVTVSVVKATEGDKFTVTLTSKTAGTVNAQKTVTVTVA